MYLDISKSTHKDKAYNRALLRTTYRDKADGKIKHRTIANLGECSTDEIAAIKLALQYKGDLGKLVDVKNVELKQGVHIGAITLLSVIAKRLGITKALQDILQDKEAVGIALWQVFARIIYQGSRLSAFKMSKHHALEECLGVEIKDKDQMYSNLTVISENIGKLEKQLFKLRNATPSLYLYDVTSSYLEGECNEYAAYGYNRDKKSGKKQIVIGLLTDDNGVPIACRVFDGNTVDTKTVETQIKLLAEEFGAKEVIIVGERGMLKTPQIESLPDGFKYITAISKVQLQTLIKQNIIQYELFDTELNEVIQDSGYNVKHILNNDEEITESSIFVSDNGKLYFIDNAGVQQQQALADIGYAKQLNNPLTATDINSIKKFLDNHDSKVTEFGLPAQGKIRYIMRLNPLRRDEIRATRESKQERLAAYIEEQNNYLQEHEKAKLATAYKKIATKLEKYNLSYLSITKDDMARKLSLSIDIEAKTQLELLDGVYCLKTDKTEADKTIIHKRYKDLAKVESVFRTMKSEHLEIRPIYVRKKTSTEAHVFIVMLSYMITLELKRLWHDTEYTVPQAISLINSITYQEVLIPNNKTQLRIPKPTTEVEELLSLANVVLPVAKQNVTTKKNPA